MMSARSRSGFSFVELVLVIALVGLLAIAIVLRPPPLSTQRLRSAAHQVLSDIQYTQNVAMTKGGVTVTGVQFVAGGTYTMYQTGVTNPLKHPLTNRTQDSVVTLSEKYSGISIQNSYTVQFNSLGAPTTGGGGGVTLTDGSSTLTIAITANTGEARIQ